MYALNNTFCAGVEIRRNYTFSKDSGSRVFSVFVCADRSIIVVLGLLWSRHYVRHRSNVCSAFKHVCFSSAEHCQQSTYANATVFLVLKNTLHAATANR